MDHRQVIGRTIKGKYRIYDQVGSGGFATVYVGRNLESNEIVAVKVLREEFTQDSRYVERFRREARMAQQLRHPNIVRVLDHGTDDWMHFLIMEFVEGLTLHEVMKRKGQLEIAEALSYGAQVLAGLQAAHETGIVHRDIKPANLMVMPDGTLKIMDLGIARGAAMSSLTTSGVFMGTPRYLAPELAAGSEADIRSDLYAVGLVLYEMLTGVPAFDAPTPWEIVQRQMEKQAVPIGHYRADVPAWLERTVMQALAKDPARRYQTPAEMAAALGVKADKGGGLPGPARAGTAPGPAQARPPVAARPAAPPERRRAGSRGLVLALAGAVVVVALGLVAVLAFGLLGGQATPAALPATTVVPAQMPAKSLTALPGAATPLLIVVTNTPQAAATQIALVISDTPLPQPSDTPEAPVLLVVTNTPPPQPTDTAPAPTAEASPTAPPSPTDTPLSPTNTAPPPAATAIPQPTHTPTQAPAAAPPPAATGRIAFSSGGALHLVKAAGGQDTIPPIAGMRQPDFRADGQLIIANGEGADKASLWTIEANNGAFGREQSPFTDDYRPFWSPDGGRFVYDSLHHGLGNYHMLYTQGLTSGRPQPEVPLGFNGQQIRGTSPVWLHNDWIAFTGCDYWPGGGGGGNCGIYRMPSWEGPPQRIVPGGLNLRATDNHADQLLYMSQETGDWEVYLVSIQGGAPRNLSQSPRSHDGLGTFAPDGKLVAFVSNRDGWGVWAVKPDGTGLTKLFGLPGPLTGEWIEEQISWGP